MDKYLVFQDSDEENVRYVVKIGYPPNGNLGWQIIDVILEKKNVNSIGEEYFEVVEDVNWQARLKVVMRWLLESFTNKEHGTCLTPEEFIENNDAVEKEMRML
jgi:hypothetical protein